MDHTFATRSATLALLLMAASNGSNGATDGIAGARSSGSLRISLIADPAMQISRLRDLDLQAAPGAPLRGETSACVYAGQSGRYQLRVAGSGAQQRFELRAGAETLPFRLRYDDGQGLRAVTPGLALQGLYANPTTASGCARNGDNARLLVDVPSDQATAANAGTYQGSLTLLIAPD